MKKHISSLPLLQPTQIWQVTTGEQISWVEAQATIKLLLTYCYEQSVAYYTEHEGLITTTVNNKQRITAPAEAARQAGIRIASTTLPEKVKAKSRVEKLVQYKLISESFAHEQNPNPRKKSFQFNKTINLGAVDKQMASISLEGDTLSLLWKVWDKEYLLVFQVPKYVLKRDIAKFSLPVVSEKGFIFTIQENVSTLPRNNIKAGLDLGRAEPYTIAVVNQTGNRIAHYNTSGRLKQAFHKRERLLVEKKHLLTKIDHYKMLGLDTQTLEIETRFKTRKIARLGHSLSQQTGNEIAKKLAKHKLHTLKVEDLRWVTGRKYGSKWNHSAQQAAIAHALGRQGTQTKRVNPKNSSQSCHNCGVVLTHHTSSRTVWCGECKTRLDRDFNAAMNIAKQSLPAAKRVTGSDCSHIGQVSEEYIPQGSYHKEEKQLI